MSPPYRKTLVLIDSDTRPTGTAPSNFSYVYQQRCENVVAITLKQCLIENGYVFQASGGFTVSGDAFRLGGAEISIPIGTYSDTSLSQWLADNLNQYVDSSGGLFFVSVNAQGFLQITNDTTADWTLDFSGNSATQTILGFSDALVSPTDNGGSPYNLRSDVNIRIPDNTLLMIQSNTLGQNIYSSKGFSAFETIPFQATSDNTSNMISYYNWDEEGSEIRPTFNPPKVVDRIDIRLIDSNNHEVVLPAGNRLLLLISMYSTDAVCVKSFCS